MSDRLARGKQKFDEVYGEGGSDRLVAAQTGLAQDLARYGIEFASMATPKPVNLLLCLQNRRSSPALPKEPWNCER
jgi:hypothetical protein